MKFYILFVFIISFCAFILNFFLCIVHFKGYISTENFNFIRLWCLFLFLLQIFVYTQRTTCSTFIESLEAIISSVCVMIGLVYVTEVWIFFWTEMTTKLEIYYYPETKEDKSYIYLYLHNLLSSCQNTSAFLILVYILTTLSVYSTSSFYVSGDNNNIDMCVNFHKHNVTNTKHIFLLVFNRTLLQH